MTRQLIAVSRENMEEAIKSLDIGDKVLARKSRDMWDILLASDDEGNSLSGSIMTTKLVRLQTYETEESNPAWSAIIYFA